MDAGTARSLATGYPRAAPSAASRSA
jgi:hypothetical protein